MSDEEQTILTTRGMISTLSEAEQKDVLAAYDAIKALEEKYGESAARFAVALRGAELSL